MTEETAESWQQKGDILFQADRFEEALDCYLNATDINPDLASAWHNMGMICLMLGEQDEADICFQREWEIIQRKSRERPLATVSPVSADLRPVGTPGTAEVPHSAPGISLVPPGVQEGESQPASALFIKPEQTPLIPPEAGSVQEQVHPATPLQTEGTEESSQSIPVFEGITGAGQSIPTHVPGVPDGVTPGTPAPRQISEGATPLIPVAPAELDEDHPGTHGQTGVQHLEPHQQASQPLAQNPMELYQNALQLSRNNLHKEALLAFDRVLLLDPSNYRAWNSRGIAFARLEHYPEAEESFSRSLAINPSYQEAINNLAKVRALLGDRTAIIPGEFPESALIGGSTDKPPAIHGQMVICPHCMTEVPRDDRGTCPACGRSMREAREEPPAHKSPILAAIFSFFVPGLGQVYTGKNSRGILFLIGAFAGFILLLVPGIIVLLYSMYDAYKTANMINTGQQPYHKASTLMIVLFVIAAILMAIVIFLLVTSFMLRKTV